MNFVGGWSAAKGGSDGLVQVKGDYVVGYRDWKDGNHFEVTAPAALEPAVRYIVEHLTEAPSSAPSSGASSL